MSDFCVQESCPSPCKRDTNRARDEPGNYTLLEEINSDEKYVEHMKQYHTANKCDLHKQWLWQTQDLQRRERLSKRKPVISRYAFSKCIPNHIQKKDYLSQFACESGVQHEWMHHSLIKTLQDNHDCGNPNKCNN